MPIPPDLIELLFVILICFCLGIAAGSVIVGLWQRSEP